MKIKFSIFFFSILFFCYLFFPGQTQAAPTTTLSAESTNAFLYTYDSACPNLENINRPRAIILPKGISGIDTVYLHFHGKDFTHGEKEAQTYDPATTSNLNSLYTKYDWDERVAELKTSGVNAVIFMPRLKQTGSTGQTISSGEFTCFYNEAKEVLTSLTPFSDSTIILSGHSAGGNTIRQYLKHGLPASTTLFFDACYGNWCKDAASYGGGTHFISYTEVNSPGTIPDSNNAKEKAPDKVKLILANRLNHGDVFRQCFKDHLSFDELANQTTGSYTALCGGKGTVVGSNPPALVKEETETKVIENQPFSFAPPKLSVLADICKLKPVSGLTGQDVNFPWISQCVVGLYKYFVVFGALLSVLLIIIGGILYLTAGFSAKNVETGKSMVLKSLYGLIILLSSFVILLAINPDLTNPSSLSVNLISEKIIENAIVDLADAQDSSAIAATSGAACKTIEECRILCANKSAWQNDFPGMYQIADTVQAIEATGLKSDKGTLIPKTLVDPLERAGQIANQKGYTIRIVSGFRSLKSELNIVCSKYIGQGAAQEAKLGPIKAWPGTSDHSMGRAVDVTLIDNATNKAVTTSSSDSQADPKWVKGTRILATIMYEAGWQRYLKEIWHFEYNPAKTCRTNSCYVYSDSCSCPE
ncbi:hypothetical protein A2533_01835 [Candidatus Falkowbacteria bacterium RIFOXYD2_FULL_35_9]|uniref:D-alanyl-D-alanine carboxypeptidase-like core domain-containing protein n=1 Tax=Candidatus Falkowbacteria bacterium RIFOXYC2_FULL_36_12 TaxID=1798002 RepID=A0A1F5T0L6_9BACT|nr:MAG: hypothetical protein A2300_02415 [Candidatus Falkowbacteria bacterium RIFOXYB2_FULL_35_7]OGF32490.1 MAG: hypothetical protein A2478_02545 [Candidatus Falkowbacteria bacterium RIFOXYC2_FULL_36_12]OGF46258.1 MAG: hypothetical protein A2533_01835 [Candidatus Falkowbacteria bacterium RIFOXYD2_FULL_35_9]